MTDWFENGKTLVVLLLWLFLAVIEGLQLHNLTNSIEIDCFNKRSQQDNEWCTLFLTVHRRAPFELCQDLNNGDRALALAETWALNSASEIRGFCLFVCLLACFWFCRKPHFNHSDYLLVLTSFGVFRKVIKYQKEIFAISVF